MLKKGKKNKKNKPTVSSRLKNQISSSSGKIKAQTKYAKTPEPNTKLKNTQINLI